MPLFGSIAGAESVLLAFDDDYEPSAAMAEAPHGTAPALQGKDIANPMAMILACAAVLAYAATRPRGRRPRLARDLRVRCSRRPRPACARPTWAATRRTTEFTDEVIERVRTKIDIWCARSSGRRA